MHLMEHGKIRAKWRWECVRRNEDYVKDYQKHGKFNETRGYKEIDDEQTNKMMSEKWRLSCILPDPNKPIDLGEHLFYPLPANQFFSVVYFKDRAGEEQIRVLRPGQLRAQKIGSKLVKDEYKEWTIYDYERQVHEKMTKENCPRSMMIHFPIELFLARASLEERLMKTFKNAHKLVTEAQKKVLRRKPFVTDPDDLEKCIKVYDLKKTNPAMSWSNIAKEIFPKRTKLSPTRTQEKARYYWKLANYYINEGGWETL